jgi:parvulin-like peptidyl-prolyl isomerase
VSAHGKPPLRLILYLGIIAYLVSDLFVFKGALHRTLVGSHIVEQEIAARVSGHPITRSQLERAVNEQLWLEGKSIELLTPQELEIARKSALDELIDHELLRLQANADSPPLLVSDEEINERLRRLVGRFESKGALETAMKSQGIATEQNLRERLAARIRQEKLIRQHIAAAVMIPDEEARKWFDENQASIALPERIEARHIFLPTLDHPSEEAKQKLAAVLVELTEKKKDFATLAKEVSEDPATKEIGGTLGWMTRDRLPTDFATPVFSLAMNTPTLVRTRLGWHLVEVTARKPAEPRTFEQAKPEVISALEVVKRKQTTEDFRKSLRQKSSGEIEILESPGEIQRN